MPMFVVRGRFLPRESSMLCPEAALFRDINFGLHTAHFEVRPRAVHFGARECCMEHAVFAERRMPVGVTPQRRCTRYIDGEAESSIGLAQGLTRTLRDHVEHKFGQRLRPKSPLLSCMIEQVRRMRGLSSQDSSLKHDGMPVSI